MQQCGPELVRCLALGCNPTWGASRAASVAGAMAGARCPAGMEERIRVLSEQIRQSRSQKRGRRGHDESSMIVPGQCLRVSLGVLA